MNSFVERLRESFNDYSRQPDSQKVYDLKRKIAQDELNLKYGVPLVSDGAFAAGAGAATSAVGPMAAGSALGPVGLALGAAGMGAGAYIRARGSEKNIAARREHNEELQKELTNQWTEYKNKRIADVTGRSVGDLAREGKMVTDDGDIVDIDYGYYKTVPRTTLERVFGDGADAVWEKAHSKK